MSESAIMRVRVVVTQKAWWHNLLLPVLKHEKTASAYTNTQGHGTNTFTCTTYEWVHK